MKKIYLSLSLLVLSSNLFANSIYPESKSNYTIGGQTSNFASFANAEADLLQNNPNYIKNTSSDTNDGQDTNTYKSFIKTGEAWGGGGGEGAFRGCAYEGITTDLSKCAYKSPSTTCAVSGIQNLSMSKGAWVYGTNSVIQPVEFNYTLSGNHYDTELGHWRWTCDGTGTPRTNSGRFVASGYYKEKVVINKVNSGTSSSDCNTCNPINLSTGNKTRTEPDYVGKYLEFVRYYNSKQEDLFDANLGHGWTHSYSDRVVLKEGFTGHFSKLVMKDGLLDNFAGTISGRSYYHPGRWMTGKGNEFHYVLPDQVRIFSSDGYLQRILFNSGLVTTIERDLDNTISQVIDPFGRTLSFIYDTTTGSKILAKIILPDANEISYALDTMNNLETVTYQDSSVKQYHYEDPNYSAVLTGITDENGERYATFGYDLDGRAILSELANGFERITVTSSQDVGKSVTTTLTNSKGSAISKTFRTFYGIRRLNGTETADGFSQRQTYPNKLSAIPYYSFDKNGNKTKQDSSTRYNGITKLELGVGTEDSQKTDTYYKTFYYGNIALPRINIVFKDTYRADYKYDGNSRVPNQITYKDLTNNAVPYSTLNQTRVISYEFDTFGLVSKVDGPRTDINDHTTYERDDFGNLIKTSVGDCLLNGPCMTTTYSNHNAHGQPQQITDENGVVTNVTYHPRGWVTESTTHYTAGSQTTRYEHDLVGQVTKVILPNGEYLAYEFNGARYMMAIENSLGERIELIRDTEGNVTQQVVRSAGGMIVGQQNKVFSDTSRLLKTISGEGYETSFIQDPNGNVTSVIDPLNNTTGLSYDALNRIKTAVDAKVGTVSKTYTKLNKLATVTDQNGNVTSFVHNGFGDTIQESSPDTGTKIFWLDAASNMTSRQNSDGTVVNYTFDALNRPMNTIYENTQENISITYDAGINENGRLSSIDFEHGNISFDYLDNGQTSKVSHVINGSTYDLDFQFNNLGSPTSMTYPSGLTVSYQRDQQGNLTGLEASGGSLPGNHVIANNMMYGAFNSYIKGFQYGNGISKTVGADKDGQTTFVKHTAAADIFNETYSYFKPKQISTITDQVDPYKSQSFNYSPIEELTFASGAYGQITYTHDPVSNRKTRNIQAKSILESYNYAADSNRLLDVSINGISRYFNFDILGNTKDDNSADKNVTSDFNDQNRPVTVTVNGEINNYVYNPLGQRIVDNDKTLIYGKSGELLSIITPAMTTEYIYLQGEVIATVSNGIIAFHHNNYMGVTRVITDESGETVWTGDYLPFGELREEVGALDNLLRLPGQYNNPETGYYYNYFRDYDPALGRYLQSDPIGLAGGLNTYGYVGADPINKTDQMGLYFDYSGLTPEFEALIKQNIAKIKSKSPHHRYIIERMEKDTTNSWKIQHGNGGAVSRDDRTITLDINEKCSTDYDNQKGLISKLDITMAHEFQHAYDLDNKSFENFKNGNKIAISKSTKKGYKYQSWKNVFYYSIFSVISDAQYRVYYEKRAIMSENIYRKSINAGYRNDYSQWGIGVENNDVGFKIEK